MHVGAILMMQISTDCKRTLPIINLITFFFDVSTLNDVTISNDFFKNYSMGGKSCYFCMLYSIFQKKWQT